MEAPMHKKLTKSAAFVALFAFLFILAPGLFNAAPRKVDIKLLLKQPAIWISSFWSIIPPIFDSRDNARAIIPSNSTAKIKPLTESVSVKPSKND